jgi:hypothetical protein
VEVWLRERTPYTPEESAGFTTNVVRTFGGSVSALGTFGQGLALFLVALLPWLPILLLVGGVLTVLWRRRARALAGSSSAVPVLEQAPPPGVGGQPE